jgi:hypothetical protein
VPLSSRARTIARRIFNAVGDQRNLAQCATRTQSAAFHPGGSLGSVPIRRGRRLPLREAANAPSFEGNLSTHYLRLKDARYFVTTLIAPGDALCKPQLPELYEPVLTNIGHGVLMLRGFEREGEAATVQEWRCEVLHRIITGE